MKCIAFYSYKGGVGRSLALANLSVLLGHLKKRVFALDLDLEAPGLHYKYGVPPRPGVLECFTETLKSRAFPPSLAPYVIKTDLEVAGEVFLMTAGAAPSLSYWRDLSQVNWFELLFGPEAPGIPFFLELKHRIAEEYAPDYVLIDSRTGITEIGGVATAVLADTVVCLLANNRENIEGAREVLRGICQAKRPPGIAPLQVIPVLARVPAGDVPQEQACAENALRVLNQRPDELGREFAFPQLRVIHSWPELEMRERVVTKTLEQAGSDLFREYCDVFADVLPEMPILLRAVVVERLKGNAPAAPGEFWRFLTSAVSPLGDLTLWRALASRGRFVSADSSGSELAQIAAAQAEQAIQLHESGKHHEALAASTEAVRLYRELAEADPEAFQPVLAISLHNQAAMLSKVGQRAEALAASTEAVGLYRKLSETNPKGFRLGLARALNSQAIQLHESGKRHEALAAITEAIEIFREVPETQPERFATDLATSFGARGLILEADGQHDSASESYGSGLRGILPLARAQPEAVGPLFAWLLDAWARAGRRTGMLLGEDPGEWLQRFLESIPGEDDAHANASD